MLRRKTPQENHVTAVESKQKQPSVPQGILIGKLDFLFLSFFKIE
jgi:hypothetical protein